MGATKLRHLAPLFSPCVMWGAVDDRSTHTHTETQQETPQMSLAWNCQKVPDTRTLARDRERERESLFK